MNRQNGIAAGRLPDGELQQNFADIHPPLTRAQALVEASRCYFCFDAPCIEACPTGIDIPAFIRKITTDNLKGSARDILSANIMGGVCARVCPTEVLCEGVCVRNTSEEKPVTIGALQRYTTDWLFEHDIQLFQRKADSGKRVAVIGAGPAGLSCAHALAQAGHRVTVFEARAKSGGLNEYGIAAYKVPDRFARREVDYILSLGSIEVRNEQVLGRDFYLNALRRDYDAVFLGLGLSAVNALGLADEDELTAVDNAVDYIAMLRQSDDLGRLPVGRRVVVIGGGSTAIDIAIQSKRLGAEEVTLVYRRGEGYMSATWKESAFAQINHVKILCWARPLTLNAIAGIVRSVTFERTGLDDQERLHGTGETFELEADVVYKAIGQAFDGTSLADAGEMPALSGGRIAVDDHFRTSLDNVWAGGDCVTEGADLTVTAVEHGKLAAQAIDRYLQN